jgi:hypothetical protein
MRFPYAVDHAYCLVSTTASSVFKIIRLLILKYESIKGETKMAKWRMENRFCEESTEKFVI